jgi:hypothetical protein
MKLFAAVLIAVLSSACTLTPAQRAILRQEALDCTTVNVLTPAAGQVASCAQQAFSATCLPGQDSCWAQALETCAASAGISDALAICACEARVAYEALLGCVAAPVTVGTAPTTACTVADQTSVRTDQKLSRLVVARHLLPRTK